jgi:hypothetical protein
VKLLDETCNEAGPGVSYEVVLQTLDYIGVTALDDSNPWWKSFKETCDNLSVNNQTDRLNYAF